MITHIIEEAVFLADRIVVMGTSPATSARSFTNPLPHPRDYQSPQFLGMVQRSTTSSCPSTCPKPAGAARANRITSLRAATLVHLAEVFGLMEVLRDRGGQMDVFRLDTLTDYDFGHTLAVVKAGEMLEFLDTPKNNVILSTLGKKLLETNINARKAC